VFTWNIYWLELHVLSQVAFEQAISGPWSNFIFMVYFGLILEGIENSALP
jgi:hypothetical protein